MTTRRRKRHSPEQIIAKLHDADALLNSGKDLAVVLQALEISQSTYERWRDQYGGMKAEEAKRLKELEDENRRLKQVAAAQDEDPVGETPPSAFVRQSRRPGAIQRVPKSRQS